MKKTSLRFKTKSSMNTPAFTRQWTVRLRTETCFWRSSAMLGLWPRSQIQPGSCQRGFKGNMELISMSLLIRRSLVCILRYGVLVIFLGYFHSHVYKHLRDNRKTLWNFNFRVWVQFMAKSCLISLACHWLTADITWLRDTPIRRNSCQKSSWIM